MSKLSLPHALVTLLEMLKRDPIRALDRCRDRYKASAASHHETVYEIIAFIVEFVLHLRKSEPDEREFLSHEYWSFKPQGPKRKNLSRLATMYVLGAKESRGALYDQALIYTKVVDHFLGIEISPEGITTELKRKPIYKLLDEIAARDERENEPGSEQGVVSSRAAAKQVNGQGFEVSSDPEDENLLGDDLNAGSGDGNREYEPELQERGTAGRSGGDLGPGHSGARKPSRFDRNKHIALLHGDFRDVMLALRLRQRLWVCIERVGDVDDDWKELSAVDVRAIAPN